MYNINFRHRIIYIIIYIIILFKEKSSLSECSEARNATDIVMSVADKQVSILRIVPRDNSQMSQVLFLEFGIR